MALRYYLRPTMEEGKHLNVACKSLALDEHLRPVRWRKRLEEDIGLSKQRIIGYVSPLYFKATNA